MSAIGPGDFVECVDARCDPGHIWEPGAAPQEGAVYTVERCFIDRVDGEACLYLKEICRGPQCVRDYGEDTGYAARRFRPIYRPKQTLITDLLTKAPNQLEPA